MVSYAIKLVLYTICYSTTDILGNNLSVNMNFMITYMQFYP